MAMTIPAALAVGTVVGISRLVFGGCIGFRVFETPFGPLDDSRTGGDRVTALL